MVREGISGVSRRITINSDGGGMHIGQDVEITYLLTPVGQNSDGIVIGEEFKCTKSRPSFPNQKQIAMAGWVCVQRAS